MLPDLMYMFDRLIEIPSISSVNPDFDTGNQLLVENLAEFCESAGAVIDVFPLMGYQHPKSNLVATFGTGVQGLVLAGHTDTVPCDPSLWSQDPFRLTKLDGKLYGLGMCDMKSFFALVLEALRVFDHRDFQHPLILLATADEESSMDGARKLATQTQLPACHAVIGEPTNLEPIRMHKGIIMECIRLHGRSGHSSNPDLGNSALEGMHHIIAELLCWRDELQDLHQNPLFEIPVPTMNLGYIHGGDNPNRICGMCELHIDLRPLPGMSLSKLRMEMEKRLQRVAQKRNLQLEIHSLFAGTPAMETSADAPLVQALESFTGQTSKAVSFGTEAPYLQAMGMDVVIWGPGDIACAHQHDEYLAIDRIQPTIEILRKLIQRFCL